MVGADIALGLHVRRLCDVHLLSPGYNETIGELICAVRCTLILAYGLSTGPGATPPVP